MIDTDCSWWYTNRQNSYTVVCILIEYIILYGIILHVYHYICRSFLTDPINPTRGCCDQLQMLPHLMPSAFITTGWSVMCWNFYCKPLHAVYCKLQIFSIPMIWFQKSMYVQQQIKFKTFVLFCFWKSNMEYFHPPAESSPLQKGTIPPS